MPRELYEPSNVFGLRGVLAIGGGLCLCLAPLSFLGHAASLWWLVALVPLMGAYIYKLTIVLHECGHRTLFTSRRVNEMVGRACAGLLGVSYAGFTSSHWDHHRYCGTRDETGEGDYLRLEHASAGQMVWHLVRPLTGVAYLRTLADYLTPRTGGPTREASELDAAIGGAAPPRIGSALGDSAWIAGTQLVVAALATGVGRSWWPALVYPATAATFGLFFSRVRAFCEHVSAHRAPGQCFVRSHMPNPFDRVFFYTLNMNLHVEHHFFPQVPACRLWAVRERLRAAGVLEPEMTSTSVLRTIRECLADARRRDTSDRTRAQSA